MTDEAAGDLQAGVEAEQQQGNGSSSDEYDPQAAQTDYISPPRAKDSIVQSLPLDTTTVPNTLPQTPTAPLDPTASSASFPLDKTAPDRQSLSRSMSRASSQSDDGVEVTTMQELGQAQSTDNQEIIIARTSGGNSAEATAPISSLDPVSDSSLNVSTNTISSDTVQIQNDVQDQNLISSAPKGTANTVPNLAAVIPDTGASFHSEATAKPTETLPAPTATDATPSRAAVPPTPTASVPRARLPHDKVGILEDRVKEDPRGDLSAWLNLLDEHKKRGKIDDARAVYERFLALFPSAAEEWIAYGQMENESGKANAMDNVLFRALPSNPYLPLWSLYLDHVRRHNNLTTDTSGDARQVIYQAYDVALKHVGLDKDSGKLWQDYVNFIKTGPGNIGGSGWQDQQKMDSLRKVYQRAICIPHQFTNLLWKEYDGFEMGLNKMTGRKFLQDQSPSYMSARSSYTELQNITRNLRRTTLPVLPPASGFDGDADYAEQLEIWKRWIQWEKDDPLVFKQDDIASYRERVTFVYKHALMAMRFWPELWSDASDFCFANDMELEGNDFLTQGIAANPESCLLAFKRADRIELSTTNEEGDESAIRRGSAVREVYDKVLDTLYDLITKSKSREAQEVARIETSFIDANDLPSNGVDAENANETGEPSEENNKEKQKALQLESVKSAHAAQIQTLSRTLSHVWIALIRAMRRIQGKGKPNESPAGLRGTFADARKRGRITSDVYTACALIEFHCYEEETGKKIFERGLKLFPEDETFALRFIKHLVANNDHTNARVTFETAANKLAQKPETVSKAKPLYVFFHDFECRYGELNQIVKLEKRMKDLFPDDPTLASFSSRFVEQEFDPTAVRPIVSPAAQTRPKATSTIESNGTAQDSPPSGFRS